MLCATKADKRRNERKRGKQMQDGEKSINRKAWASKHCHVARGREGIFNFSGKGVGIGFIFK
jgi:hypothetical protein